MLDSLMLGTIITGGEGMKIGKRLPGPTMSVDTRKELWIHKTLVEDWEQVLTPKLLLPIS